MILQKIFVPKILRRTYLLSIFLFLFFYAALSQTTKNKNSDGNNWSGNITYISTVQTNRAAPYSEFIYKKWYHFYEQRMEVNVLNGKGIAKSFTSLIDTNYNREETGSRIVEQWENEKGNAQGSDNTEVNIAINREKKTYSIEVPIPATKGSKTKTYLCKGCGQPSPNPVTTSMGEDETMIMIEDEKLGENPNVLTGEKTERKKIDNNEGEEIIITRWKLTRVKK